MIFYIERNIGQVKKRNFTLPFHLLMRSDVHLVVEHGTKNNRIVSDN